MDSKNREFPQYRKLSNGLRLYCIESKNRFKEIQVMGTRRSLFLHEAKQYPELVLIMDMLSCNGPYEVVEAVEWEENLKGLDHII